MGLCTLHTALVMAAAAVAVAASKAQGSWVGDESLVTTEYGPIRGVVGPTSRTFRGVPFAAPPVGQYRWAPPVPPLAWSAPLNTTVDASACLQNGGGSGSEDCLYLNVFTPRVAAMPTPVPVMVWIHGGAFFEGECGGWQFNATYLAATTNIIVVCIQYRLGALGFLYLPEGEGITGNYALLDQQWGLKWVQRNIAAFGGDPNAVTIDGQSAGGMSVAAHLSMPSSQGLYHRAIIQSDPFAFPYRPVQQAITLGQAFTQFANCTQQQSSWVDGNGKVYPTGAACLRGQTAEVVMSAQMSAETDVFADIFSRILYIAVTWAPTVNTTLLPLAPIDAATTPGAYFNDVPTIMGTVRDEMHGLLYVIVGFNISMLEYDVVLDVVFGSGDAVAIDNAYPIPTPQPTDLRSQMCVVTTPAVFRCATRNVARALAQRPGRQSPLWVYHWVHHSSFASYYYGVGPSDCYLNRVCHSAELAYLFQTDPQWPVTYTPAEAILSATMQAYWSSFIIGGVPVASGAVKGAPAWPTVNATSAAAFPTLVFDTPAPYPTNVTYDGEECDFWDSLGYNWY